jgi:tetratricopeptide (TPR) repeat protein
MRQAQETWRSGADPWLGLGRVYLREGDLLAARAQFEEAARRAPGDPRPSAFLGTLYRRMGEYERALNLLLPLARQYPADRATHFDVGLSYLRTGRHEEAAEAFTRMLALDPDDVSAHYNLWMCFQRLRRHADARREEAIYRYLRPEEGTSPALARYLRAHADAADELRAIHEHHLRPARLPDQNIIR